MKIVMVPSGFKECLDAEEVASAMERGARRFNRDVDVEVVPMIDGGEGFAKTIVRLKAGKTIYREVTGPVGEKIVSHFGVFVENGKKTAVIEMAAVAGLKLVPRDRRDPLKTTTYGVGELILSALDLGIDQILIGCGDSGTSDGGAGLAQALGVQFLDKNQKPVEICGGVDLLQAEYIDTTRLDNRLSAVTIDVACNWNNILCGDLGVARVFRPPKRSISRTGRTIICRAGALCLFNSKNDGIGCQVITRKRRIRRVRGGSYHFCWCHPTSEV